MNNKPCTVNTFPLPFGYLSLVSLAPAVHIKHENGNNFTGRAYDHNIQAMTQWMTYNTDTKSSDKDKFESQWKLPTKMR